MPSAGADVVEEDVAVGMAPGGCDRLIQPEPRSSVGAALHDKHCRAARRPFFPHLRFGGAIGRAANAFSSVVKRGDHRRRSFELLAKPSVLVRSGGDASAQRLGLAAPSTAVPHSRRMVFARWTVATERQGGFSPAEGPSPDASVT